MLNSSRALIRCGNAAIPSNVLSTFPIGATIVCEKGTWKQRTITPSFLLAGVTTYANESCSNAEKLCDTTSDPLLFDLSNQITNPLMDDNASQKLEMSDVESFKNTGKSSCYICM